MLKRRQIETLMLIDDDELDHILCKRVVDQSGLVKNLIRFYYAEEALEYLKDDSNPKVDLILLDINMPRMSGFDFLRKASIDLTDSCFDAPVVMLTTSTLAEDRERAFQYEIVKRYMNKPLNSDHLREALELL